MIWVKAFLGAMVMVVGLSAMSHARDSLQRSWEVFQEVHVAADGRVVDDGNAGISHSESQGYTLLLAAELDSPGVFARVWTWTRNNLLIRDDGLVAWRYDPESQPPITDVNNASDGDLLIAHALSLAAKRWQRQDYREAAEDLALAIRNNLVREVGPYTLLIPGSEGFDQDDGLVVNPSYWIFASLEEMQELDPDPTWQALIDSGRELLRDLIATYPLIPDWVVVQADGSFAPTEDLPWESGYNALRVPLYLAGGGVEEAEVPGAFARSWGDEGTPFPVIQPLDGEAEVEFNDDPAYDALRQLLACARQEQGVGQRSLSPESFYYPATLLLLSNLYRDRGFPEC
ncbi:glycosyl hydrolase family 8 [Aquibaculum arenosum]|uniref:cellulase n=1 Tax=Aquibaculum arenosum TaxID=3032591 RepID=A0ABT5YPM7_9PROT|nr:glycosyl hydrolase family 8 [Fodinicurvata sp. CAU 1616]MDF2096928.1 glycosyl hydrolase family 8 [Fodinicurvata sp. CAU 1616]